MNARWASTLVIWLDAPSSHHYHACMLAVQEETFSSIITTTYRMRYFGWKKLVTECLRWWDRQPWEGDSSLYLSLGAIWTCNGEGMCCVACRPYANAGPSSVGRDNCQLYMHSSTLFAGTASHKSSLAGYTVPIPPPMMSIYRHVHFGACFILLYVSMPVKLDAINGDRLRPF